MGVPAILSPRDAARATPDQIRDAIRQAYSEMQRRYPSDGISYDNMGAAIDQFLVDNGVP
jgi:hypothetical protein